MSNWTVILLGIIEGLTEFLPVSSTGHLLLAEHWLNLAMQPSEMFNVVIQSGAVLAVLFAFAGRISQMLRDWRTPLVRDYVFKLAAAFAVTSVGGLLLKKLGLSLPETAAPVAWATLIGGIVILVVERVLGKQSGSSLISWPVAIAVGLSQIIAVAFPGTSRSGVTIIVGLTLGLGRPAATEFSFLLGVPTLLAASGYTLLSTLRHPNQPHEPWLQLGLGIIVAAVTAFIVVRWLLRYVQNHTFVVFGWYRIVLGALILGLSMVLAHSRAGGISTLAGTGVAGYAGDNGRAKAAKLANPYGLARGPDGALYICEVDNHIIRRIAPDETITTVAGTGQRGYSGDGGPAREARLNEPYEVRFDPHGNMLFVEMKNHLVRQVDAGGRRIRTVAGNGQAGFSGDGGPATAARLNQPHSIQLDREGNLYICDIGNHRIRKVETKTGTISTVAGTGSKGPTPDGANIAGTPLYGPRAIDFDREGNLWLALREGNAVYQLDLRAGKLHHMAGNGVQGFTGNGGPARQASLSGPKGLSLGPNGNVYLADTESHSIRMIDLKKGTLELIAGTGERGDGPEGDPLGCRMARPHGIFVEANGTILIGDSEAHRVRAIRTP